jgi:cytochrome c-type biogenesis protein CcmH
LKQNPTDPQGWRMLGWSYFHLDRFADASKAFEHAIALDGKNVELRSQYGESVVRAAGGLVTPEAEKIFDAALAIDPRDPRAQFFRGLALDQRGKSREALALWVKILREGKADADWVPALRERAVALAVKLKLNPVKEVPGAAVTSAAVAAAPEQKSGPSDASSHADSTATIDQLSQRLEASPKDYEGWILLARSYRAVGKTELALASLARAKEIFSGAPFVLQKIEAAKAEMTKSAGEPPSPVVARGPTAEDVAAASQLAPAEQNVMIAGMVSRLEERLKSSPNDLDGWLMLARSRKVLGDVSAARTAIGRAANVFRGDAAAQTKIAQVAAELQLN